MKAYARGALNSRAIHDVPAGLKTSLPGTLKNHVKPMAPTIKISADLPGA